VGDLTFLRAASGQLQKVAQGFGEVLSEGAKAVGDEWKPTGGVPKGVGVGARALSAGHAFATSAVPQAAGHVVGAGGRLAGKALTYLPSKAYGALRGGGTSLAGRAARAVGGEALAIGRRAGPLGVAMNVGMGGLGTEFAQSGEHAARSAEFNSIVAGARRLGG